MSTVPGMADAAPTSFDLEKRPPSRGRSADRDVRRRPARHVRLAARRADGTPSTAQAASGRATADAAGLFQDHGPSKRRLTAAEARSRARRCIHCGGGVPQGMSICPTCGTDQETGMRVGLDDDLAPPPPPRPQGPPLHVSIIGGLVRHGRPSSSMLPGRHQVDPGRVQRRKLCVARLALVSAFGIFACVQFIRGKSVKLLMLALTLGSGVDVIGLVAFPTRPANARGSGSDRQTGQTERTRRIRRRDQVHWKNGSNTERIKLGVVVIVIYAVVSLYLMSPPVKKYIFQCRPDRFD